MTALMLSYSAARAAEAPTLTTALAMVRATKKVPPEYPQTAKQLHITGSLEVQITVSKTGGVLDAKVLKGNTMFSSSCMAAAKQWKFTPYVRDGAASDFSTVLLFTFGQ